MSSVRKSMLPIAGLILVTLQGCATQIPAGMARGAVAWSYESRLPPPSAASAPSPVSLRVGDLKSDLPVAEGSVSHGILAILPVVSLANLATWSPHYKNVNEAGGLLQRWEVEELLVQELRKSALVREVTLARDGAGGDLELRGSVNFEQGEHHHYCGLGSVLMTLSLVGVLTLPMTSVESRCDARFELVSTKDGKVLLSKDYSASSSVFTGVLYGERDRAYPAYGRKLLPRIVEELVADLRAVLLAPAARGARAER